MLISLIATKQMAEQIKKALADAGDVVFEHVGKLDSESVKEIFYSASRVSADVLIVDLDVFSGKEIVSALQGFRIARPNTRIIVIAPDRKPGDEIISSIVGLGIYDIAAEGKESNWSEIIKNILLSPPATYAQAARWHTGQLLNASIQTKERVIIEERPAGIVTVAVSATAHGIGCTYTALSVASFLSRLGHSAAVIEDSQKPVFSFLCSVLKAKEGKVEGSYTVHGIDIFPVDKSGDNGNWNYDMLLKKIKEGQYEYVVRDLGVLNSPRRREMYGADIAFVVASAAKWRWHEVIERIDGDFDIIFPLASQNNVEEISFYAGIKGTALSYCPNPFAEENDSVFLKLLAPVLPSRRKKRILFGVF
ncbi:hypothetical protein Tmath_0085 [Thermoanaerobacter mathranii subsp. mathranii str. A3]|uniref:Stage 0 sporulation protein A homolog n=1 Tax=Thermoanaerobacter mathranii subsp. mathranii (strain DSM 11426 / CCUG 53645 / CIP 108742 / A3) TaxID=583358 RepID=A0ABN3Z1D4_THEM3|nr:hypothetical protein [Thermoanaerobacter mathranii]ADH59871.1 hypothetical protein Tmath_0085 [Thermoanaerobacter mathranii subsp. mathranii str. A3]